MHHFISRPPKGQVFYQKWVFFFFFNSLEELKIYLKQMKIQGLCVHTRVCMCVCVCVYTHIWYIWGFPGGSIGKESTCNTGDLGSIPELGRSPGEAEWLLTPLFLSGESHGHRSLAGYHARGHTESDTSEGLSAHINDVYIYVHILWKYYFKLCQILATVEKLILSDLRVDTDTFSSFLKYTNHDSTVSKESAFNAADPGSIHGLGRSPEGGPTPAFLPGESHGQRNPAG